MAYAIGQVITDVITLRDDANAAILALEEDDFTTLEAYLISTPATVQLVALTEIGDGQYSTEFTPSESGSWALHYVYEDPPVFREDTRVYVVDVATEITVVSAGGTWTYTGDMTDPRQEVRFLIQDTDGSNPLFTDDEVDFALLRHSNVVRRSAISLLERLLVRYSRMADTTELDLSVRASQLFEAAKILYDTLNNPFADGSVIPYAGGISHADVNSNNANTDRVRGTFDKSPYSQPYGGVV